MEKKVIIQRKHATIENRNTHILGSIRKNVLSFSNMIYVGYIIRGDGWVYSSVGKIEAFLIMKKNI